MNLPNKLTCLRLALVPAILVVMLLPYSIVNNIIALIIFSGASITDYFDGKIARRDGLVTDFGKFLDPLADKFMVISAIFGIAIIALPAGIMTAGYMEAVEEERRRKEEEKDK